MEGTGLRSVRAVNVHEACLCFSSECSLRSGIQTDIEIIAIPDLLVNTDHMVGGDSDPLGIGKLGEAASVKTSKVLDVVAMHSV